MVEVHEWEILNISILLSITFVLSYECISLTSLLLSIVADLNQQIKNSEEASRVKSTFLATVSHEMRTPLQGIIGHTELLNNATDVSVEDKENIASIKRCAVYLLKLITEILDFSKSESYALHIESVYFSITSLLDGVKSMFSNPKGLDFRVEYGPFVATDLIGDSFKLEQCLTNLLSNAEKFTSEGFVHVRCWTERVQDGIRLSLEITDSGIGLHEFEIPRIWEPFSQADSSTSRIFGGTGLGLCTTKKYVELMNGEITCRSVKGKGTTFSLWVIVQEATPRMRPPPKLTETKQVSLNSTSIEAHHVLVVDDNKMLRQMFKMLLEKLGVRADLASGGREALQLCKKNTYSIVFLDIHMPEMDGFAAARELRKMCGPELPIIACTADVFSMDSSGYFTDNLHKPAMLEDLKSCLEKFRPKIEFTGD